MRKQDNIFFNIDLPLLIAIVLLILIGFFTVYSVSYDSESGYIFDFKEIYGKQLLWILASLFFGIILLLIDASFYQKFADYFYVVTIFLLLVVLVMPPIHGARSWLGIGGVGIQPAEFAKITTALFLSKSIHHTILSLLNVNSLFQILLIILVPGLLIALQPDAGTLLVFTSFLFVLYREGVSFDPIILFLVSPFKSIKVKSTWLGTHFIPFLFLALFLCLLSLYLSSSTYRVYGFVFSGITLLLVVLMSLGIIFLLLILRWGYPRNRKMNLIILASTLTFVLVFVSFVSFAFEKIAAPHQRNRIQLVLGLKEDPNGADYNRNRAMAAVGSGRLFGKGFLQASVSNVRTNHVPESETDFIFCPFAEEWGFMGSFFLIALYSFIILRVFHIAERQRSVFFRVYAYCVGIIIFYHVGLNIGMNIGLAPVIGIPLPFMSYGGSSILTFTSMIFILLKLDSQRKDVLR